MTDKKPLWGLTEKQELMLSCLIIGFMGSLLIHLIPCMFKTTFLQNCYNPLGIIILILKIIIVLLIVKKSYKIFRLLKSEWNQP
jgi:glucan phosphoethanolaminetransferase (alkaline phosphatase superfamily)